MTDWNRIKELIKQAASKTYPQSQDAEVLRRRNDRQNARNKQKRIERKKDDES